MGGSKGGGGSHTVEYIPMPVPEPEKLQTKNVTEAATSARDDQKVKENKSGGIAGSILTDPMAVMQDQNKLTKNKLGM